MGRPGKRSGALVLGTPLLWDGSAKYSVERPSIPTLPHHILWGGSSGYGCCSAEERPVISLFQITASRSALLFSARKVRPLPATPLPSPHGISHGQPTLQESTYKRMLKASHHSTVS